MVMVILYMVYYGLISSGLKGDTSSNFFFFY